MSEAHDESARKYPERAEAYFGAGRVAAAGVFRREVAGSLGTIQGALLGKVFDRIFRLHDRLTEGTIGGLPERFLLVVTVDKVYGYNCRRSGEVEFGSARTTLERDQVWLRRTADGDFIYLYATENGRTHEIPLMGVTGPGAAEVLAALKQQPGNEAIGLSE